MNLDDELQRLFADDRLDMPVRAGATEAVVAGARRVRRRRVALTTGAGAAALAVLAGAAFVLNGMGRTNQSTPGEGPMISASQASSTAAEPVAPTASNMPSSSGSKSTAVIKKSTTAPATKSSEQPKENEFDGTVAFGPDSYSGLRLGMTAAEAEATGLLTPNAQPVSSKGCKGYDFKGAPNGAAHYAVLISPKYGLVRLENGPARPVTAENIILGTSEADMKKAYPTSAGSHGAVGEWVTAVPGHADKRFWFIVRDGKVAEMRLELATQDCYQ